MLFHTCSFQIDFVASMRIEAVEFHKVQLVNSYSSGSGVLVTFGVEYGFNGSDLQTFSKVHAIAETFQC